MKYAFLLSLILTSTCLTAQDCAVANHYRVVTIDNSAGDALTDYQVRVRLNTLELVNDDKLRSDGGDLRIFTDDCTPLPFWGDSLGSSTNTDIWVKIPSIPAGGIMTIQIYYGNSESESVADGDNTFIFFDDFSSGIVDPAKWEAIGEYATLEVEDGILNYGGTSENPGPRFKFVRTSMPFAAQVIFDCSVTRSNSSGFGFSSADSLLHRIIFRSSEFGFDTINQVAYMSDTISNGFQANGLYPLLPFPRSEFNTVSITAETNDANRLSISRFENVTYQAVNADIYEWAEAEASAFHFILSTFGPSPIMLDNIRVRQSAVSAPTTSPGEELDPTTTGIATLVDSDAVQVFPNPASTYCMIQMNVTDQCTIEIVNETGQLVSPRARITNPAAPNRVDLTGLTPGMYYLHVHRLTDSALLQAKPFMIVR
jgi:hypothetical protein